MTATTYQIECLYTVGHGTNWEPLPYDNTFTSRAEAENAIEHLRELGDDWAEGTYRVTEIRQ